jgi:hypothetical protein
LEENGLEEASQVSPAPGPSRWDRITHAVYAGTAMIAAVTGLITAIGQGPWW